MVSINAGPSYLLAMFRLTAVASALGGASV
jgi:hypothetical protein